MYYKKCTLKHRTGRETTYENFQGKTYHQWINYLTRELNYDLRNYDLFLSEQVIDESKLLSVPKWR